MASLRPNEHLAVLIPRSLWKPDSAAVHCDNLFCHVPFSIFERKHHCRKCGGIFCGACASQSTPLLDISNLDFITPPRSVPITDFESPNSPILISRVCDDCFDQIHGSPTTPRTPELRPAFKRVLSDPVSVIKQFLPHSPTFSSQSHVDRLLSTSKQRTHLLRNQPSLSSLTTQSSSNSVPSRQASHPVLRTSRLPLLESQERSYGELDAYPLRRSSVLCKATGGGRWEPKPSPVHDWYRIPGGKAPFEIEMDKERELEQLRRENPVIKHGEFQFRFPKEPEPVDVDVSGSLNRLSTF